MTLKLNYVCYISTWLDKHNITLLLSKFHKICIALTFVVIIIENTGAARSV